MVKCNAIFFDIVNCYSATLQSAKQLKCLECEVLDIKSSGIIGPLKPLSGLFVGIVLSDYELTTTYSCFRRFSSYT